MSKPENIILIIVDCLRKDCAEDKNLMPFVNKTFRFKKEAYTNAPSTHFAVPALLTGKVPFEVTDKEGINEDNIKYYLPKIMKEDGHNTIFITGNVVTSRYFGYNQYWDYFEDFLDRDKLKGRKIIDMIKKIIPSSAMKSGNSAFSFFLRPVKKFMNRQNIEVEMKVHSDKIIEKLKAVPLKNKKNFICLHLMDPHAPYASRRISDKKTTEKIKKLTNKLYLDEKSLTEEEAKFLKEMYTEEVKDSDNYIRQIYNLLKNKLNPRKSLIVITADHGEAFGEKGYFKHPAARVDNMHHINVPFFSNREIKKSVVWSSNIYELIAGSKLSEKNFCIGYKKTSQKYVPVSFFDCKTKKTVEGESELNKKDFPENIQKVLFNRRKIVDEAIRNIKF